MKVFLDIYLDNNIGDDIMVKGVLHRFPNHTFYAINQDSVIRNSFKHYNNLIFLDEIAQKKVLSEVDAYITLGGSMFQYRSIGNMISKYKKIRKLKKLKRRNCRILTLGSNLGPFLKVYSKRLAIKELKLNDFVSVRDNKSFDFISSNIKNGSYKKFDDIVLEMDYLRKINAKMSFKGENIIGISAYRSLHNSELNFELYQSLAKFAEEKLSGNCYDKIYLFAFDTEQENDLSAAVHIKNLIDDSFADRVMIVPYLGDVNLFLEYFSRCTVHVSIRFHSAILASLFEIPYIPVSYSNKMIDYIADIDPNYEVIAMEKVSRTHKILNKYCDEGRFIHNKYEKKDGHLSELEKFLL